jgi:rRNA maturation RNase YbeY
MICFYTEDIAFSLPQKRRVKAWLKKVIEAETMQTGEVSIIFCSDDYLLQMNRHYLQHNYYTDIITFDYNENTTVNGDLFISLDTVRANAKEYKQTFERELDRVMVHGILHLCGYKDTTPQQQKCMRIAEDKYLVTKFS